jgi:predicted unusual protein kinase regulating ubiquinone biosynthesis (AarF/ABC1/UbiB family)
MTDRSRPVPQARIARLAAFGQLAGGIAAGVLGEGARRLARGERPQLPDLLLTPANAIRVTDQLSRLRGAAMKLGQMLSLDAGDVLPRELTEILSRLRDAAHIMPPQQLNTVLVAGWGTDWRRCFARFDATPIAAASIGQVHRAVLPSGKVLAIKVQYPGVAASIDADIDNVATLLRMSGLLPPSLDIAPLLAEAKRQLREEADYLRESAEMRRFGELVADDPRFVVPLPHDDLTVPGILAMDFVEGQAIDRLGEASQAVRDRTMTALFDLVLRELFVFGRMQTDPNFANYRWQPDTGRVVLLDFGAARPVPAETVAAYRALLQAGLAEDRAALRAALVRVGFLSLPLLDRHGPALDAMIGIVLDRVAGSRRSGLFDLADRSFVAALRDRAAPVAADRAAWHIPPTETLFVHRKISGTALLGVRLQARVPLIDLVLPHAAVVDQAP